MKRILDAIGLGVICILILSAAGCGWFREGAQVAREEFGPRAAVRKYEWFKDAAAQLAAKRANIDTYKSRITQLEQDYADLPRREWPRDVREDISMWRSEVSGLIANYNGLCAEYNSAMAKINFRYANIGGPPPGEDVLPRGFAEYER